MVNPNDEEADFSNSIELVNFYMICSVPRSGSSMLSQALWRTQIAGAPHEYFHSRHMEIFFERWGIDNFLDYVSFLKRKRASANGVFGFKVFYHQYKNFLRGQNLESLFPNLKYIFITRNFWIIV